MVANMDGVAGQIGSEQFGEMRRAAVLTHRHAQHLIEVAVEDAGPAS